ncbi:MAG: nucleotidyltransferase domain-containing protein [Nanoarchaeota archaeon]|nr:nucleotidyltransferase domain-containing protein [Nanoarchaeota archaeon]
MSNVTQKWVDVLIPFSSDYCGRYTASELARKTRIPQQTVSRIINGLMKINLVGYLREGKNKLFYLNLKMRNVLIMLEIVENQKMLEFNIKNPKIALILEELMVYCDSIIVFGSYSSGGFDKKSDLDIVVFGAKSVSKFKEKMRGFNIEINVHYSRYSEFLKTLRSGNALSLEIFKNHLIVGNVSKIVEVFANG